LTDLQTRRAGLSASADLLVFIARQHAQRDIPFLSVRPTLVGRLLKIRKFRPT